MRRLIAVVIASLPALAFAADSVCFGTTSNGRLEGGVQLPSSGSNFDEYSSFGAGLGRTYVHSKVRSAVVAAYASLARTNPGKVYVYGESGWAGGGRIRPHKTHQNGLSVDFMVPVLAVDGRSVRLPTSALNKFGYAIEFDRNGRFDDLTMDFDAIAEHLYALDRAARANGIGTSRVIFDRAYLPKLYRTKRGPYLRKNIHFMRGQPWIRHDEHYHVDFAVKCKPMRTTI